MTASGIFADFDTAVVGAVMMESLMREMALNLLIALPGSAAKSKLFTTAHCCVANLHWPAGCSNGNAMLEDFGNPSAYRLTFAALISKPGDHKGRLFQADLF